MKGFTLVELAVTLGILAILIGLTTVLLLSPQRKANLNAAEDLLVTDLRQQQLNSASGALSHGIYFAPDHYVLFTGSVYAPADPANTKVTLAPGLNFSAITLPASQIIFSPGSGEANFAADDLIVTLSDSQEGLSRTLHFNHYGVITEIN